MSSLLQATLSHTKFPPPVKHFPAQADQFLLIGGDKERGGCYAGILHDIHSNKVKLHKYSNHGRQQTYKFDTGNSSTQQKTQNKTK